MLSALKRLRLLPALAVWLSVCVPAPGQIVRALGRVDGGSARQPAGASSPSPSVRTSLTDLSAGPQSFAAIAELRVADLDADGNLDLVAAGREGLRTWINVRGRFVEHSPTRELLKHHTPPGFTTTRHASHVEDAVVSAERLALVDDARIVPFTEARPHARAASSPTLASRPLDAGASRAPPRSARS